MKLYSSKMKKFLKFFQRKLFLYFRKRKPRKNSLYFRKRNFLIFEEVTFQDQKNFKKNTLKKLFIFQEMQLGSPKLRKLLIFQEKTYKAQILFEHKRKRKNIFILFFIKKLNFFKLKYFLVKTFFLFP